MSVCDFRDLGRTPQKVKCPACGCIEETIRVRQRPDNSEYIKNSEHHLITLISVLIFVALRP